MTDAAAGRADAVIGWLVATTTARLVEQTVETVRTRTQIGWLDARYRSCTRESRAGHLFEEMHALSFNLEAIRRGRDVRVRVTEWLGQQNGAVDLLLVDGEVVVGEVQAKLVANPVACAHQLGRERYRGMARLVGHDDLPDVDRVLAKARTLNPDSLGYDGRVDAHARLSDTVAYGDVRSTPVTRAEARRHADRPLAWADRRVATARAREVGASALAGAASGAVLEGAIEAITQVRRVRSGDTTGGAAATATMTVALHGAARSGTMAGLGALIRVAATARVLPGLVGRAGAPMAIAGVVYDVAEAGVAFARDEIDAGGFVDRCGESALRAALSCAFAVLGQAALPVLPGVGAALGGLAGGVLAGAVVDGVRWWLSDDLVEEPAGPKQIEAVPSAERSQRDLAELIAAYGRVVGDGSGSDPGGFDDWMADPRSLVLDPNPG